MRKPSFGLVSTVVTLLALVAFFAKMTVPLIPDGPENRLAASTDDFLLQASHQQIDWRELNEDAFVEARKRDKPIMLVIGSACSMTARAMDRYTFSAKEIRGLLARNFVCVRVDSMALPEMANAFLPLSRALPQGNRRLGIPADFQIWFLDPKGNLMGFDAEIDASIPLDARTLQAELNREADLFESPQEASNPFAQTQRAELAAIESTLPQQVPDLTSYAAALAAASPADVGGFPVNGFQRLWPSAWRFQLLAGRSLDFARSIGPCLASRQFDVLDGGFFTNRTNLNWSVGGYDKLAVTNAAMLQTLALGSVSTKDPNLKWMAERCFDSLAGEFVQDGLIAAGRIGDEDNMGRSVSSSFSPRQMRERLPDDDQRNWARIALGLRVEVNPQMVPRLADLSIPLREPGRFAAVHDALAKNRPPGKFCGLAQLDSGGYCVARLIQSARILGDSTRVARAGKLFESLDAFRTLDDVTHSVRPGARAHAYLGDYLAYSDAALQHFLATGNPLSFKNGLAVLRRGLFLYAGKAHGEYLLSQPSDSALGPQDSASPEIVDNLKESCTAEIIRLCNDYGNLLGPAGSDLHVVAGDTVNRFAPASAALGPYAGGYFCAAADLQDSAYAIVTGPDSVQESGRLAALAPSRLVSPSVPEGKAALGPRGIYVFVDSERRGPLSLTQAANALGRRPLPGTR